jgi:ribonucleoside-diphosphate reductase beta chain
MLTEYSTTYVPKYTAPVEIAREHEEAHWTEAEVKLQTDVEQWKTGTITHMEKEYIKKILRLFTQSDVNVGHDYYDILIPKIKNNEVRNMLGSFAGREGVHQRAYAQLVDTLGLGEEFHSDFLDSDVGMAVHTYMIENVPKNQSEFGVYIAKQIMMEGVLLFAQFAGLMQFDLKGKLPGMSDTVRWSVRDESLHIKGLVWLFRQWCAEHPRIVNDEFKRAIYDNAREAIDLCDQLASDLGNGPCVTQKQLMEYSRYVTDYRLRQLGFKAVSTEEKDPLPDVTALFDAATMGNFFEREITEYSRNNLSGDFSGEVYSKWA